MDCSNFSNRTDIDSENLTNGDITEKYYSLKLQYEAAISSFETTKQELYETRRCYQNALDLQEHLTSEVESYQSSESKQKVELSNKIQSLQDEIHSMREERNKTAEQHQNLIEKLETKVKDLEENVSLKNNEIQLIQESEKSTFADNVESVALKNENEVLKDTLEEQKSALVESRTLVLSLKEELSNLNEELMCVKSNLISKKEELESATDLLRSTQSDLAMANCELARLKSEGSEHATKGNSLFAEVEDKRQEMAKTLILMKSNNAQLKKELANKQAEIDTLLCEKKNIWEEYVSTASRCDVQLIESYEQRITDLESTNEQQRSELSRWFAKCHTDSKLEQWVGGVLDHLKNRCENLTSDLMASSIDNLSKAAQIRDLHKQLATLKLKSNQVSIDPPQQRNELQTKKENIPAIKTENKSSRSLDVRKKVTF